jgi:thiol-disulfide isomerase/thioredoxin
MLKLRTLAVAAALFTLALSAQAVRAQGGHEYAPVVEKTINYKDWTFKSLKEGAGELNLREWAKGKKLVMVVYFAPWCGNWKMEAPVLARLYEKYKAHGFDVVAVSEYAALEQTRDFFGEGGAPYPVVVESEEGAAREKTTHYAYRQASGDTRRWGSPFNVFLEPARLNKQGDVLAEKTSVVVGELIEEDAERFIRERLGLPAQDAAKVSTAKP